MSFHVTLIVGVIACVLQVAELGAQTLFVARRSGERLMFELPRRELGKDMLVVGRYTSGAGGCGTRERAAGAGV